MSNQFNLPNKNLMELLKKLDEVNDEIYELQPNFTRMTTKEMEQFVLCSDFKTNKTEEGQRLYFLIGEVLKLEKEIKQKNNIISFTQ